MTWLKRMLSLMSLDVLGILCAGALGSTFILFGEFDTAYLLVWLQLAALFIPLQIVINYFFGLYSRIWRYASVGELLNVLMASTAGTVVVFLTIGYRAGFQVLIFRTVPLYWLLTTSVLGAMRFAIRVRRELTLDKNTVGTPTLIIGAGSAGVNLIKELQRHSELGLIPLGFIDDDPSKHGLSIGGISVLGGRQMLSGVIEELHIRKVILAIPAARTNVVRDVVARCSASGAQVLTIPGLYELVNGTVSISRIRDVQIEDLLRREEVKVDLTDIGAYITGKSVLVTGAGGSIGSELCRQIARFGPSSLVLLGKGENSIYEIHRELSQIEPSLILIPAIADVRDSDSMAHVFSATKPQVVFHAAAHKHVPLMEANPAEAVKNNVWGTYTVARLTAEHGCERFVLISSDKAVNPTSVMGATKRVAELVVQLFRDNKTTRFMSVRFGNVLGSRGSVVPLFKEQIANGGPITITHPEMVRYFMTIPEAVSLVLQAGALGEGGEVFVLDMGEPVRIVDMAEDLITLSGLRPHVDIKIRYTGIRPGEKLYEELLTETEGAAMTKHSRIYIAPQPCITHSDLDCLINEVKKWVQMSDISGEEFVAYVNDFDKRFSEVAAGRSH